jgi:hypothetical protein
MVRLLLFGGGCRKRYSCWLTIYLICVKLEFRVEVCRTLWCHRPSWIRRWCSNRATSVIIKLTRVEVLWFVCPFRPLASFRIGQSGFVACAITRRVLSRSSIMGIGSSLTCCGLVLGLIWLLASLLIRSGVGYSGIERISTMSRSYMGAKTSQSPLLRDTDGTETYISTMWRICLFTR